MADASASRSEAGVLHVASYNVHGCVGLDARRDPARIARVIAELDVDAIGLQELDSRDHAESGPEPLAHLEALTGMTTVAGPTLRGHRGEYGNALLTRCSVLEVDRCDLSFGDREPRGALDVAVDTRHGPVRIVITHLGLRAVERRLQAERLVRWLDRDARRPIILMGDLNEWNPRGAALRHLRATLGRPSATRSFPARLPLLALDRICVTPPARLESVHAHRSRLARRASDHLPVRARVRLADAAPAGADRRPAPARYPGEAGRPARARGEER